VHRRAQNVGHHDDDYTTTLASACAAMGLRDPLVVRREESEARAKAAPPHKVVTGRPRAPVGELVYFDKELILLFFSPLILLLSPVGFFLKDLKDWQLQSFTYPYTLAFNSIVIF